jgi:uncharacterized protein Usg
MQCEQTCNNLISVTQLQDAKLNNVLKLLISYMLESLDGPVHKVKINSMRIFVPHHYHNFRLTLRNIHSVVFWVTTL